MEKWWLEGYEYAQNKHNRGQTMNEIKVID